MDSLFDSLGTCKHSAIRLRIFTSGFDVDLSAVPA
jgi:hypothetical protein